MRASTRLTILTAPRHGGSLYAIVNNKSRRAMEAAMHAHVSNPVGASERRPWRRSAGRSPQPQIAGIETW